MPPDMWTNDLDGAAAAARDLDPGPDLPEPDYDDLYDESCTCGLNPDCPH